ncbi:Putative membrane protein [Amycolatopsis japonica]|uniref:Putative membrane protein n=1 Tax=Amycolatopsis japonica TaxID=208439 RepID=A0A075UTU8_9PSEU|nr:Putative membrane protein [Amycolatopsis japonica]
MLKDANPTLELGVEVYKVSLISKHDCCRVVIAADIVGCGCVVIEVFIGGIIRSERLFSMSTFQLNKLSYASFINGAVVKKVDPLLKTVRKAP